MKDGLFVGGLRTVSGRVLCVWLTCIAAITLAPFDFGSIPLATVHGRAPFQYGAYQQDPLDFVFNVLLFLPVGALLHHATRDRTDRFARSLRLAALTGLLASASVEYLQVFLTQRDSSLVDVLADTLGSLAGVFADRAWGADINAAIDSVRARVSPGLLVSLLASFAILALSTSAALQARTRLTNWNDDYPLLIGNELTGDRPWRGQVFLVEMTDAATPMRQVRRFAAGDSVTLGGTRVATFDFHGHGSYEDRIGTAPALDWTAEPDVESSVGVRLSERAWLRTSTPAAGVARRVRDAGAFTLRVVCASAGPGQTGPARIVSNSESTLRRNFTIGQDGADLIFRLRTAATGLNGYPLEFVVPNVFTSASTRDIVITYDGATLLAAVANGRDVMRAELSPGATLALAVSPEHVGLHELGVYKVGYLAGLFVVPGILLAVLGRSARYRVVFGGIWIVVFAFLIEVALTFANGRSLDPLDVAFTAAVGGVVLIAAAVVLSPAGKPPLRPPAWQLVGQPTHPA
jgi:VanZ family protein